MQRRRKWTWSFHSVGYLLCVCAFLVVGLLWALGRIEWPAVRTLVLCISLAWLIARGVRFLFVK